jgi:hypothetical protein
MSTQEQGDMTDLHEEFESLATTLVLAQQEIGLYLETAVPSLSPRAKRPLSHDHHHHHHQTKSVSFDNSVPVSRLQQLAAGGGAESVTEQEDKTATISSKSLIPTVKSTTSSAKVVEKRHHDQKKSTAELKMVLLFMLETLEAAEESERKSIHVEAFAITMRSRVSIEALLYEERMLFPHRLSLDNEIASESRSRADIVRDESSSLKKTKKMVLCFFFSFFSHFMFESHILHIYFYIFYIYIF